MTRIIAGYARGATLVVPKAGTRPTSERVREALFSALEARDELRGLRVVDLYAGSGALGLEAASRGAASVVLVEKSPAAIRAARQNAALVAAKSSDGRAPSVEVVPADVRAYLPRAAAASFDLVFMDPPYELATESITDDLETLVPLLADQALVVIERRSRDTEPPWPAGLSFETKKQYGDTVLWWARRDGQPAAPDQPE